MNVWCHWWTHGVALVRLCDSGYRSMRNKSRKEHGWLYCVNRVDYGRGSGLEAGLCKLNKQTRQRRLQEQTETMRNIETLRLTVIQSDVSCDVWFDVWCDVFFVVTVRGKVGPILNIIPACRTRRFCGWLSTTSHNCDHHSHSQY
jgi:hypothetical protein